METRARELHTWALGDKGMVGEGGGKDGGYYDKRGGKGDKSGKSGKRSSR